MNPLARTHHHPLLPALGATLLLAACGDPAPGEGVESPLMQKPMPEIISAQQAIQTPDLPTIDPQTLHESEIEKVLPAGPRCAFAYTAESPPVLAATIAGTNGALGVIKIHGKLVKVTAASILSYEALAAGARFTTDGVIITVTLPEDEDLDSTRWPADMEFELEQGLQVGYRGWYSCND